MKLSCRTILRRSPPPAPRCGVARVFAPPYRPGQTRQDRHPGAALGHCRQRRRQRPARHRNGRSRRFNAAGGIAGRKIELVVDEETNAKDTIERFQKLVQQEKVDCVQGIVSTGVGLALGPVVEEARALTIFWDGTTQDGVDEKLPNPKYLFRSTDNECEAVMSSLLAIKHWKGQFKTHRRHQSRTTPTAATTWRPSCALLKRFNIEHEVVTEQWPKVGTMELTSHVAALQGRQARPDLLLAAVRRPAGVHETGARGRG